MDDSTAFRLSQALIEAIDDALDAGASPADVKAELAYQIKNYDWDAT